MSDSRAAAERSPWGAGLLCIGLLLGGCSTEPVVAPSQFPKPVLAKIPVSMGLYMAPAFRGYVHDDKPTPDSILQQVSVGPASQTLFTEFLSAQFDRLVVLDQPPGAQTDAIGIEAVLQPEVQDVQIQSPLRKDEEFHEAWIKYRLRLLTPRGEELTSWELAAYGKHRGQFIGGTHSGLTAAVTDAMRDVAAGMALIFRDGDGFRTRLRNASAVAEGRSAAASSGTGTASP